MKKPLPILFTGNMVTQILLDRKTETRRIVKLPPGYDLEEKDDGTLWPYYRYCANGEDGFMPSPYGEPGDRLYVREKYKYADWSEDGEPWIEYAAGGRKLIHGDMIPEDWHEKLSDIWAELSPADGGIACDKKWRPSIHMPRWASRIMLNVVSVHTEKLIDITPQGALAEGVGSVAEFYDLWESINGERPSPSNNPLVYVIEFKRIANGVK